MKTDSCYECSERRQLDFIQRVGRIGYWEYDSAQRAMTLPSASLDLLASIVGSPADARRSFMDALDDTERKRFQIALDQAAANKMVLNSALDLTCFNGDHAHVVVRGVPLEFENGALRFAGTFQDMTNEKQRGADHESVITQMQALLDALPQGVSVVDKELKLMLWNRRLSEVLDFPPSLLFRHARFEDFIRFNAARGDYGPGDPDEQVQAIVARASEFLPHQFERQLANGRTVLVEGFPFRTGGEISGFVTTYTDTTDPKRTEEQLTRQRDVMKTVIDNFPGGISLCDTDLRFTAYNDQFIELLDFPPALFTKGWVDFEDLVRFNVARGEYGPGDPEEQVRASVTRAHNFQAHRIERARPNGRWLEIRGTPIPSGGFVTSYIDITERKLIEAELVHAKETAEARGEQVTSLLDNSGQGFLSFGSDLLVQAECSRACKTMLGLSPAGRDAAQVLFADDVAKADLLRAIIPSVLAESDPDIRESMLSLLPKEIQRDDVILKAEYTLLDSGNFMLVLTDMTEERRMAALLDRERRHLELIVKAVSDSRNFFETIDGFREFLALGLSRLLHSGAAPLVLARELYREIHTCKGLLNQFSFPNAPVALHGIETHLSGLLTLGDALTTQQLAALVSRATLQAAFDTDLAILTDALGEGFLDHGKPFVLSHAQAQALEKLATCLLRGETIDTSATGIRSLLDELRTLRKVTFKDVLIGFDGLVKQAAQRLEKQVAPIEVTSEVDVWVDPDAYRPFLRTLVHVFLNAVTHGIESQQDRRDAEKDETGKITCTIALEEDTIKLCIADDGGGINLDALRLRAVAAGLYDATEVHSVPDQDIAGLTFLDSISTQEEVTALAGRGVGLAVVLNETEKMGGKVVVETAAGQGTRFLFTLPLQQDEPDKETRYDH